MSLCICVCDPFGLYCSAKCCVEYNTNLRCVILTLRRSQILSMVEPEASVQITVVGQQNSGTQINHFTGELKPIAENNYLLIRITDCYKLFEIIWNANLMQKGNFIDVFLVRHVSWYIRPTSGALDIELQHMVYCTEFLDGWWSLEPHRTHDLRSGSQDHHPSKNSVQKTVCCNSASNAPDDGRMYPKHVELRIRQ